MSILAQVLGYALFVAVVVGLVTSRIRKLRQRWRSTKQSYTGNE